MSDFRNALAFVLCEASVEELSKFNDAIRQRREDLARRARYTLGVGSKVKFTSRGKQYEGVVKAVKVKYAHVECPNPDPRVVRSYNAQLQPVPNTVTYRVPLSILEAGE